MYIYLNFLLFLKVSYSSYIHFNLTFQKWKKSAKSLESLAKFWHKAFLSTVNVSPVVVAKRCCKRESPRLGGPSLMPLRHQLLLLEQWSSLKPRTAKRPLNLTYLLRESRSQRKGRGPFPTTAAKIKKATLPPPFKRYLHKIPFYRTLLLPSFFLKKGDGKFFFFSEPKNSALLSRNILLLVLLVLKVLGSSWICGLYRSFLRGR